MSPTNWPDAQAWRSGLAKREQTRWPGPRPLTPDDGPHALVGRDTALQEFVEAVRLRQLIHFRGESGVGKSSFLMAGAIPAMRRMGRSVLICRSWALDGDGFDQFLARQLRASLPEAERGEYGPTTRSLFDQMSANGDVMVLDQFEELIRHDSRLRRQVFIFLRNVIRGSNIRVVLSYRSDSLSLFADLAPMIDLNVVKTIVLQPVKVEHGLDLIRSPRLPEGTSSWEEVIAPPAAQRTFDLWRTANELTPQIGLLHLQALLYDLENRAEARAGNAHAEITETDVAAFEARAEAVLTRRGAPLTSPALMSYALEEAASRRLRLASDIAGRLGWGQYLIAAVNRMTAEILPELSSGGFKVELELAHLAEKVLEDELEHAYNAVPRDRRDASSRSDVVAAVVATLRHSTDDGSVDRPSRPSSSRISMRRTELVGHLAAELGWSVQAVDAWLNALGEPQMTSGPTLGLSDAAVLVEQVRAFSWAAIWLHELNLARLSSTDRGATITLIHDGFGEPLKRWAATWALDNPAWVFGAIAASPGAVHDLSDLGSVSEASISGTLGQPKVHMNVTLKGNSILFGRISNAVFVNCDFRGALFLKCVFEGVTFVNCRLDGALLSDCVVTGDHPFELEPSHTEPAVLRSVETYSFDDLTGTQVIASARVTQVVDLEEQARAIAQYTESTGEGPLLAAEAGSPMRIARPDDAGGAPLLALSGLVIHGGRASALTVRGTTFESGAALVFNRTRGSGVDLAEVRVAPDAENATRLVVRESVLRHVSLTCADSGPVHETPGAGNDATTPFPRIAITVDNSGLAQWWIGRGIRGTVRIENSQCAQLWVDEPAAEGHPGVEAVVASGSWVKDLFGFTAEEGCKVLGNEADDPGGLQLEFFREGSRSTDYRR